MSLATPLAAPVAVLGLSSTSLLVVLPLVLEAAVLLRGAYTRRPTDLVLAAVAVPCLVVSAWALAGAGSPNGGVSWGGVFSAAAGVVLAFLVAADLVVGLAVRARAPSDPSAD